ncbi:MAG TPA: hypothetical protein VF595_15745 [Tepidisphaeraceae bacterium]
MTHIEHVEGRRLCALAPDAGFGTGGQIALPSSYIPFNLLATHGAIYVDTHDQQRENRHVIFKFTNKGRRDTAWGRGGYVVPGLFPGYSTGNPGYDMAYDTRTGGLLIGNTENAVLKVMRLTADGQPDAAWGDNGRIVYSEKKTFLQLGMMKPLANKRVLIAFDRQQQLGTPFKGTAKPGGADDVALVRIDRLGRFDKTFNAAKPLTVVAGGYSADVQYDRGVAVSGTENFNDPTFRDLTLNDDGTYHVITTTQYGKSFLTPPVRNQGVAFSSRTTTSAESRVVSGDGALIKKKASTYVLKRDKTYLVGDASRSNYVVRGAFAVEDNGIAVLANADGDTALKRIGPDWFSAVINVLPPGDEEYRPYLAYVVQNDSDQTLAVGSQGELKLYKAGLSRVGEAVYIEDYPYSVTLDDDGRVVSAAPGQLTRLH